MALTQTFRPVAAGNHSELTPNGAANNWDCVNDTTSDGDATYVEVAADANYVDTYKIDATSISDYVTIRSVTVYAVIKTGVVAAGDQKIVVRIGGSNYFSSDLGLGSNAPYTLTSNTWNTNPNTSSGWTKSNLDSLEIGINLSYARCTQVYCIVEYAELAIKVGKDGVNALTETDPNDFIFHSSFNTLKIVVEGTYSPTLGDTGGAEANAQVAHGQDAHYFTFAFCEFETGRVGTAGTKDHNANFWFVDLFISDDYINFRYINDTGGDYDPTFKYYICEMDVQN